MSTSMGIKEIAAPDYLKQKFPSRQEFNLNKEDCNGLSMKLYISS